MVKDAEENAAKDKAKRELDEARNNADALVHATEKSLTDLGDKAPADDKKAAEDAIAAVKAVKDGEDTEAIKTATQKLTEIAMKLGEAVYKAQAAAEQGAAGAAQPGAEAKKDDNVVDADFEEEKDDKKKSA